jgi:hypothetical protein
MHNSAPRLFMAAPVALTLLLSLGSASHAGYVVNFTESGGNVVAVGSGTINLADLVTGYTYRYNAASVDPSNGELFLGQAGVQIFDSVSGPSAFGSGSLQGASSFTGDGVAILADLNELDVEIGYTSGDYLSSSSTWDNATFGSLGLTSGTYTWTWGSGANADFFRINIGTSSVPEPGSLMMLGTGSLAILGFARRRRRVSA